MEVNQIFFPSLLILQLTKASDIVGKNISLKFKYAFPNLDELINDIPDFEKVSLFISVLQLRDSSTNIEGTSTPPPVTINFT